MQWRSNAIDTSPVHLPATPSFVAAAGLVQLIDGIPSGERVSKPA